MLGCNESNIIFQQHLCKLGQLRRSNSQAFGQAMKKRPTGHTLWPEKVLQRCSIVLLRGRKCGFMYVHYLTGALFTSVVQWKSNSLLVPVTWWHCVCIGVCVCACVSVSLESTYRDFHVCMCVYGCVSVSLESSCIIILIEIFVCVCVHIKVSVCAGVLHNSRRQFLQHLPG